jgi:hypothetical protein
MDGECHQMNDRGGALLAHRYLPINYVLLIDEAGQIGGKQMHALLRVAQENHARVILSGDTRQHGAVEASGALRAIEKYSGLVPIELTRIRRQIPALAEPVEEQERIKEYREAVAEARDGKVAQSFDRLDKLNAIEQCTVADQHERIAVRYLQLTSENQSCVIVSQSWNEIHKVNDEIRVALKRKGLIGEAETMVTALQPVDLTDAQKRDARSYSPDTVLVFNRDVTGFKAGESARMTLIAGEHLIVTGTTRVAQIPFKELEKATVCQRKDMALSPGDKLQLKANGQSVENEKLANGELVRVKIVHADGRIALADGRTLDKDFRLLVRGYSPLPLFIAGTQVGVRFGVSDGEWAFCVNYLTLRQGCKYIVQTIFAEKVKYRL